jgi:serine/threonine-protein kinase
LDSNDIVPRDIKPANIFLNHDGKIKRCDFGISKSTQYNRTATTMPKGTAQYAPPLFLDEENM